MSRKNKGKKNSPGQNGLKVAVNQKSETPSVTKKTAITTSSATIKPEQSGAKLLEQQRAEFALQQIQQAVAREEQGKYKHSQVKSFCRRFPSMVQSNGFGQAVAFFYSKRNDYPAYDVVYRLVEEWLCQNDRIYAAFSDAAEPKLLTAITQSDQVAYRQATAETQALMVWVKKFAEGLILKDEEAH